MDADTFRRSAEAIRPFLAMLAAAGAEDAPMDRLRRIGIEAETAMFAATGGVNTHRGAIFGLGLLCAAAGLGADTSDSWLGHLVESRWGQDVLAGPVLLHSHGTAMRRRHGAGGARIEAAQGFPTLYRIGLPALRLGRGLAPGDPEAARVQACFALMAELEDTNLLHRGGQEGLDFIRMATRGFLRDGGVGQPHWRERAADIHRHAVERRLSPGGSADLLAMTLFVDAVEARP